MSSVVPIHIQNIRLTCQIHLNKRRTFSYTILTHRPFSPIYILSSHKNHLIRSLSQPKYLYLYPHKTKNHAQTFAHTIFSPHFVGMFLQIHFPLLHAQEISVRPIPMLDKLPVKAIHRIFQDSEGYIWYGTFDGLCRYDGYDIKVYRSDLSNPNLLASNYITYIAEDHEKKIWFGTTNGLYTLDKSTQQIKTIPLEGSQDPNVFSINVTRDGTIWASVPGILFRFRTDGSLVGKYKTEYNQAPQCAYIVYETPNGDLLISLTYSGMFKFDQQGHTLTPYFPDPDYRCIERIIWDETHQCYWLGTWERGIVRFDPKSKGRKNAMSLNLCPRL